MATSRFVKNLIKGKAVEIIFEQMFRESNKYMVNHYGFEYTAPQLIDNRELTLDQRESMKEVRVAPDFILIDPGKRVMLVEVKYRSECGIEEIRERAQVISSHWSNSWIFYATKNGFYFDRCKDILANNDIKKLSEEVIPSEIQQKYHEIVEEFSTVFEN